jgi:uncharacterized protein (DUF885 family)
MTRDRADIGSKLEEVIARARAALPDMVANPPSGVIVLKPFPEYTEATSPARQLFRASDDGTRPATFSYRTNPSLFPRVIAESLTMQMLLSDGALPFTALSFKIDRWIAARR